MIDLVKTIVLREWRRIRRDGKPILLVAVFPLAFVAALAIVYAPKKVLRVPVLIVDQDHSALSRSLTRAILANETYSLGGYADSVEEFPALVAQDRAHLCFVFPRDLERNLRGRREAKVELMADASNILAGSVEVANAFNLLGTFAVGVELRMFEAKTGITSTLALRHALPIQTGMRVWFNPGFTSNYLNFLAVGICTIPIQLGGFLISIRSGSSEYEEDEKEHLSRMTRNPWAIIAGKVLAYVAIIFPVSMAVLYTPHVFCGTPMMGSSLILALMTLWFTSLLVTVGFGLSCLFADPLFATEVCALVTLPNFLLSGFTWPVFAMSKVLWVLAYGMPLFSFSFLFRKISLMGAPAADGLPQMGILGIWTCIALVLARLGVHKMMKAGNPGEISHA